MRTQEIVKDWPHVPVHRLNEDGVYMVTAATLYKQRLFNTPDKLTLLENCSRLPETTTGNYKRGRFSPITITLLHEDRIHHRI